MDKPSNEAINAQERWTLKMLSLRKRERVSFLSSRRLPANHDIRGAWCIRSVCGLQWLSWEMTFISTDLRILFLIYKYANCTRRELETINQFWVVDRKPHPSICRAPPPTQDQKIHSALDSSSSSWFGSSSILSLSILMSDFSWFRSKLHWL
jgi:hypothetical protein